MNAKQQIEEDGLVIALLEADLLAAKTEIQRLTRALARIGFYCAGTEFDHVSKFVLEIKSGAQV